MNIQEIEVKSVITKTNLPVTDYAVNPYVGCLHACKYCYASFMKRFTNHPELDGLYRDIYTRKDRTYWSELDTDLRRFCAEKGLLYVRNDDTVRAKHGEPPVVVNYFYHEEIIPSARKEQLRKTRTCC